MRRAVVRVASDSLRLYPAPRADDFIASASKLYGVRKDMILAGNGSDELLAMLFRATLGPGDTVAYPVPTYSLYDNLWPRFRKRVLGFPVEDDFSIPLEELPFMRANLTIVCNPNSPSGILTPTPKLAKLARALRDRLLVIDEAYVDFASENAIGLLRRFPNVIILRTLSKSFSLAGMRLGLCFARPVIIEELMKVKDSYNLSRIALAAGAEALNDAAWMRRNVEKVKHTREGTIARLRKLGFEVPDSAANFVLARMAGHDLERLARAIRKRGILVRYFPRRCCATRCGFRLAPCRNERAVQSDRRESVHLESQRCGRVCQTAMSIKNLFGGFRRTPKEKSEEPAASEAQAEDARCIAGLGNPGEEHSRPAQRRVPGRRANRQIQTRAIRSQKVQRHACRDRARR